MRELRVDRQDGATIVTLDRDAKRNALSESLVEELIAEVDAATRRDTRLLVLRGHGRCFSAGFDFTGYDRQSPGDLLLRLVRIETLLQAIEHAPMTTVALVHGPVFGVGADLAIACTHRVCDPDTRFVMPGPRFGLIIGAARLARKTRPAWAERVLAGTLTVDAPTALREGLATELRAVSEWDAAVAELTADASALDRGTARRLRAALTEDTRDTDLAALVRSAAEPGLITRIRKFREDQR